MRSQLELGLGLGYWGSKPPTDLIETAVEAESLGYSSIWTSEAYGSDALTPIAYLASHTSRVKFGMSVAQISARTPAAMAMSAITLDHLTTGRMILGLGVSGPQVVEGWYGQPFSKPLARTREYVSIIRNILRREEPLTNTGTHYPLPYRGADSWNLGKPLRSITHPLRSDLPIHLGAEGPRNVALACEIGDGWLPMYYSPFREDLYDLPLSGATSSFEISAMVPCVIADTVDDAISAIKPTIALYVGGMGAREGNFHNDLLSRMGYQDEARRIQELFLTGRRSEAIAAVPDSFVDEVSLCGSKERIHDRLQAWRASRVTRLIVATRSRATVRAMADVFAD